MRNGKKWIVAAGALMATCALTSCAMPKAFSDIMGDERYLPEGSTQTFGTPRRPILNPLHNAPRSPEQDETAHSYNAPSDRPLTVASAPVSGGAERRVPTDNAAILSGNAVPAPASTAIPAPAAMAMTTPVTGVDEALARKPIAAVEAPAAVAPAAIPEEPTEGIIKLIPPSSPNPSAQGQQSSAAASMPVTATTPVETMEPVVRTRPAVDAVASTPADAAPTSYPSLASIPDAPEATPATQIASDIRALEDERRETQTASQQLMNDPSSTVLTSPSTGQLASNAATAPVAATPAAPAHQETWLNNLLGPADKKAEEAKQAEADRKAAETVAAALAETAPQQQDLTIPPAPGALPAITNEQQTATTPAPSVLDQLASAAPSTPTSAAATTAPVAAATVPELTPPAAAPANETAAVVAAANAAQAPAAGASTPASAMDTVKLTPPVNVAEATAVKADKELTDIVEQPVAEEAQPLPAKKVEYLPESRYAKRRLAPVNEAY